MKIPPVCHGWARVSHIGNLSGPGGDGSTPAVAPSGHLAAGQRYCLANLRGQRAPQFQISVQLKNLETGLASLQSSAAQYHQETAHTSEPPPPSAELLQTKDRVGQELAALKGKLADYARQYGPLPDASITTKVEDVARQVEETERLLSVSITLRNTFIEQYKNRATLQSQFIVDRKGPVHSASSDGDMMVAGRDNDLGLVIVGEIMNAAAERPAISLLAFAEGTN